jgi:hypothetical protein
MTMPPDLDAAFRVHPPLVRQATLSITGGEPQDLPEQWFRSEDPRIHALIPAGISIITPMVFAKNRRLKWSTKYGLKASRSWSCLRLQ